MNGIECLAYKAIGKGSLYGTANVYVHKWGVTIFGIQIHVKNGRRWVNFPSRPYEENGEKKYIPNLRFKDRNNMEFFSKDVIGAIEKYCYDNSIANKKNCCQDEQKELELPF